MKSKGRERFLRYAPLILWIGVIFYFSTASASMSKTSIFVRPILEFLFPNATEETLIAYHSFIRKTAHFIEYSILGFWAARAFYNSSKTLLRNHYIVSALLLVVSVATIDEINQSFNPTRTGSPWDVLLDAASGATMLAVYYLATKIYQRRSETKKRV